MATPDTTQRRAVLATVLSTLTATSYLIASGSTQLVASAFLDVPPSAEEAGPRRSSATPTKARTRDGRGILHRNIFDATTGSIEWDDPVAEVAEPDADEPPPPPVQDWQPGDPPPPACEGSIRLVASYVRRGDPDQSFAAITGATGTSLLYRAGMTVDERTVVAVQPQFVVMRPASGQLCSCSMFSAVPAVAATPPVTAQPVVAVEAPQTESSGGLEASELDSNIQQLSDTSYAINRQLVDRILANQAELMRTARVIPHEEDGRVVGVKIYGIRRSSVLGRLGIQNGDMLRTLNGYDMTSPDSVLEAYTRLRQADRLSLSLVRRGQAVSMDYQVR